MKQACKAVPPSPEEGLNGSDDLREGGPRPAELGQTPKSGFQAANSNDLLPSVRPRTPQNPASAVRKRRRLARMASGDGIDAPAQSFLVPRPAERLDDVGGISSILENICELIEWPLIHSNVYEHLGVDPPRGILLHGPPGCGKTLLAHAIAGDFGVSFLKVSGPEIVSGMSGESERKLRNIFSEAVRLSPSIIFVDEVDAIASRREGASKEMERRIVSQLLTCIDNLATRSAMRKPAGPENREPDSRSTDGNDRDQRLDATEHTEDVSADDAIDSSSEKCPPVIVIAATNRPESLEPALRRAGRFDREIELGAPDEEARVAILSKLCRHLKLGADFDAALLAKKSAGYVGADLHLLAKEAGLACIRRIAQKRRLGHEHRDVSIGEDKKGMLETAFSNGNLVDEEEEMLLQQRNETVDEQMNDVSSRTSEEPCTRNAAAAAAILERVQRQEQELFGKRKFTSSDLEGCAIEMCDFAKALNTIQPSALREGFATRPDVSWDNVGSLEAVREEMMMAVVEPIRRPEMFTSLGLNAPSGVLLYGPPGCGKTLLARAVAAESGANFISVKGPELLSKYVGDSELAVRKVFARARSSSPCVIFFDELDALAPRRGGKGGESGASERVVNMLLTEMDGFSERKQVFLVAATNRPDIIDPAMLRPGRLDKLVYVPLPDQRGRASILKTLIRNVKIAEDVDTEAVSASPKCEGFSGADLQSVIRTAGERALRERLKDEEIDGIGTGLFIRRKHFDQALELVLPSVSPRDAKLYRNMENWLRKTRGHLSKEGDQQP
ncbi:unnamed protein product [Chondrus crispus]|uniref:AAA+ ATPase domain-containing protein n=1 Tax=Chondrus crispus TaxID=2769 RepID=R7QFF8_CHOCR|nr:unnamed protein product [Chondrus crispus]CDF36155.1 unnamed protein product [Chondrus crispus]|eukprot:XP_005715974.1 unnamed protein product [Chondrus crispus]